VTQGILDEAGDSFRFNSNLSLTSSLSTPCGPDIQIAPAILSFLCLSMLLSAALYYH